MRAAVNDHWLGLGCTGSSFTSTGVFRASMASAMDDPRPLLEICDLSIGFPDRDGHLRSVVDRVSLAVAAGERVGLVGESGSGKTLTAMAVLGLVPDPGRIVAGAVRVDGLDLGSATAAELRRVRGGIVGLVFQEPGSAINPVYSVGFQLRESIRCQRSLSRAESRREALDLLCLVGLEEPEAVARAYPHQLSGGQAQRAMIALALGGRPRLLVADEPTSALDAIARAQILDLLRRLGDELDLGLLLISHDLALVAGLVRRVLVMYAGEIVEAAPAADIFDHALHPYTRMLLAARPGAGRERRADPGRKPAATSAPPSRGCRFAGRCPEAQPCCGREHPELEPIGHERLLRCPVVSARAEPG